VPPLNPFRDPRPVASQETGSQAFCNQSPRRAAAIDVGTNTVRLLVGETKSRGRLRSIFAAQEITRLGEGLLPSREIQPAPMDRTLAVLSRYRDAATSHGAEAILALGTSALREARNRDVFLRRAREEASLWVQVISG